MSNRTKSMIVAFCGFVSGGLTLTGMSALIIEMFDKCETTAQTVMTGSFGILIAIVSVLFMTFVGLGMSADILDEL